MTMSFWARQVELDPATGMPKVPDGYFWRVTAPKRDSNYYHVALCLTKRRGSVVIGDHPIGRGDMDAEEVVDAAAYAWVRNRQIQQHFDRLKPIRFDLLGDYPPKALDREVGGGS